MEQGNWSCYHCLLFCLDHTHQQSQHGQVVVNWVVGVWVANTLICTARACIVIVVAACDWFALSTQVLNPFNMFAIASCHNWGCCGVAVGWEVSVSSWVCCVPSRLSDQVFWFKDSIVVSDKIPEGNMRSFKQEGMLQELSKITPWGGENFPWVGKRHGKSLVVVSNCHRQDR